MILPFLGRSRILVFENIHNLFTAIWRCPRMCNEVYSVEMRLAKCGSTEQLAEVLALPIIDRPAEGDGEI
jgi:hypothetical protein